MVRKYFILFGIIISTALLLVSAKYYPRVSPYNKNSIGYDWKTNYLSNLFGEKAATGSDNEPLTFGLLSWLKNISLSP
jgi:hypothetical protein